MERFKKNYTSLIVMAVVAFSLTIVLSQQCSAVTTAEQMANWPVAMYEGEELAKMREWEKTWAGKKINKDNIAQVKDFLSEQFYQVLSRPELQINGGYNYRWNTPPRCRSTQIVFDASQFQP